MVARESGASTLTAVRSRLRLPVSAITACIAVWVGTDMFGNAAWGQEGAVPQSNLVQLATEYVDAIGDLRLARLDLKTAQAVGGETEAQIRLQTAEMKVRLLRGIVEAEHESARANLERLRALAKRAAISPNQIPPAETRVRILQLISELEPEGKKPEGQAVPNSKMSSIPVQKEWTGIQSGVAQASNQVIEDIETWSKLWKQIHARQSSVPDVPEIDFGKQTVLAVFMGRKPTGGYATKITRIADTGQRIEATVQERAPGPGDIVTQALTSPYHIVAIPKVDKPVAFRSQGEE